MANLNQMTFGNEKEQYPLADRKYDLNLFSMEPSDFQSIVEKPEEYLWTKFVEKMANAGYFTGPYLHYFACAYGSEQNFIDNMNKPFTHFGNLIFLHEYDNGIRVYRDYMYNYVFDSEGYLLGFGYERTDCKSRKNISADDIYSIIKKYSSEYNLHIVNESGAIYTCQGIGRFKLKDYDKDKYSITGEDIVVDDNFDRYVDSFGCGKNVLSSTNVAMMNVKSVIAKSEVLSKYSNVPVRDILYLHVKPSMVERVKDLLDKSNKMEDRLQFDKYVLIVNDDNVVFVLIATEMIEAISHIYGHIPTRSLYYVKAREDLVEFLNKNNFDLNMLGTQWEYELLSSKPKRKILW